MKTHVQSSEAAHCASPSAGGIPARDEPVLGSDLDVRLPPPSNAKSPSYQKRRGRRRGRLLLMSTPQASAPAVRVVVFLGILGVLVLLFAARMNTSAGIRGCCLGLDDMMRWEARGGSGAEQLQSEMPSSTLTASGWRKPATRPADAHVVALGGRASAGGQPSNSAAAGGPKAASSGLTESGGDSVETADDRRAMGGATGGATGGHAGRLRVGAPGVKSVLSAETKAGASAKKAELAGRRSETFTCKRKAGEAGEAAAVEAGVGRQEKVHEDKANQFNQDQTGAAVAVATPTPQRVPGGCKT